MNYKFKQILFTLILMLGLVLLSTICFAKEVQDELKIVLVKYSYPYTEVQIRPEINGVYLNGTALNSNRYSTSYGSNVKIGTNTGSVTVDYNGLSATAKFNITKKSINSDDIIVTLDRDEFTYDGTVKKAKVTSVKIGSKTLKAGTDYSVSYYSNENYKTLGYKHVQVLLKGNYSGSKSVSFQIVRRKDLNAELDNYKFTYDGKVHKPGVTVTNSKGDKLKEGVDYTLTYYDYKDVGDCHLVVSGTGNYCDSIYPHFTIEPKPLSKSDFDLEVCFSIPNYSTQRKDDFITEIIDSVEPKPGSGITKSDYKIKFMDGNGNDIYPYDARLPLTENVKKLVILSNNKNYSGRLEYTLTYNKFDITKISISNPQLILRKTLATQYNQFSLSSTIPIKFEYNGETLLEFYSVSMSDYNYDSIENKYVIDKSLDVCTPIEIKYNTNNNFLEIILKGKGDYKGSKTIMIKVVDANKKYKKGDINGNGTLQDADAILLKNIINKKETIVPAADVNGDGKLNSKDYDALTNLIKMEKIKKGASNIKSTGTTSTSKKSNGTTITKTTK